VQRERVRALYLSLLGRLADQYFRECDYPAALEYALRLLSDDPCREDAHRLVMRCHVRLGERAQALRQYRVCQQILAAEFEARPEPLTSVLFDRVRLDPANV
jgi:DNA-binding SARP family transcriptional activator